MKEKAICDDLKAVLKEAKKMGCKEVKAFHNIPLENVEVVINALEIQTPKAIKIQRWCSAYCPNCEIELSEHLGDGYHTYPTYLEMCPEYGQKIVWDESDA